MGECIAVVSGKGGTGKTSFVAGVGSALAQAGKHVLCIDCDVGLRNLDLALGLTDKALMDFSDVAQGRCTLEKAVVSQSRLPTLDLLTAPVRNRGRPVSEDQFRVLMGQGPAERYDCWFARSPQPGWTADFVSPCAGRTAAFSLPRRTPHPCGTRSIL